MAFEILTGRHVLNPRLMSIHLKALIGPKRFSRLSDTHRVHSDAMSATFFLYRTECCLFILQNRMLSFHSTEPNAVFSFSRTGIRSVLTHRNTPVRVRPYANVTFCRVKCS